MQWFESFTSWDVLRLMCGAFFLPHLAAKLFHPAGPKGFFTAAGLPPVLFLRLGIVVEIVLATGLLLNIYAQQAALGAAAFMLVAAIAVLKVTKGEWLWNKGGCEYTVFWMLCCLIVAAGP